jgi:hypothetical protein
MLDMIDHTAVCKRIVFRWYQIHRNNHAVQNNSHATQRTSGIDEVGLQRLQHLHFGLTAFPTLGAFLPETEMVLDDGKVAGATCTGVISSMSLDPDKLLQPSTKSITSSMRNMSECGVSVATLPGSSGSWTSLALSFFASGA